MTESGDFQATCEEYHVPYDIDLSVKGASYHELLDVIREIFNKIESKYPDQKKVSFLRTIPMLICFLI